ncbi:ParB/RepB/Spo0J family partition protein [Elusimicrobiota bacterium]
MKKVLGKGLESLIPEDQDSQLRNIKISRIIPNKYQMRNIFSEEKIVELSESIKEKGLVQPVVVTRKGKDYMLVAGERRWRASKMAGLEYIPCIERSSSDEDSLTVSLIENIQRENLSPVEEAMAYDKLINEFGMTQIEIADKVSKSRSAVANILRILTLPEDLRELIIQEKISAGHAKALLTVKNPAKRKKLADKILKEKLTVREAEKLAAIVSGNIQKKKKKPGSKFDDPEIRKIEDEFEKKLGTKVNISVKKGMKGNIRIEFYSINDFERISELICGK